MTRITLLLCALALLFAAQAQDRATQGSALERDIPALLASHAIPSVSLAQIRGGKIVLTMAIGQQSPGVPATPRTLYNTASLAKPLSAEIMLRLAAKGAFTLDDPMYPVFVDPDIAADPRSHLLTPRLALSHQTGFPNWRAKSGLAFIHDPGAAYGYSGEGYGYGAHFAEKKTGLPLETLADNILFKPLGMADTSYVGKPWFDGRIAIPTDASGNALTPHIAQHGIAADLVYTTANDYARFMISVFRDEGLSRALAADRIRIQRSQTQQICVGDKVASCPVDIGPGLGWQVLAFAHHTVLMHNGKDNGLCTFAYLDKTSGDGAVILTNGDNGCEIVLPVLERIGASPDLLAFLRAQQ